MGFIVLPQQQGQKMGQLIWLLDILINVIRTFTDSNNLYLLLSKNCKSYNEEKLYCALDTVFPQSLRALEKIAPLNSLRP